MEELIFTAWSIYGSRFREDQNRKGIRKIIENTISNFKELPFVPVIKKCFEDLSVSREISVTKEFKNCWEEILAILQLKQPVLITGNSGGGKSEMINTLSKALRKKVVHLYITPETEPESLVGHFVPEHKSIIWKEGVITKAAREGIWVIIENLSEAQSTVLERLNSILESPPQWIVTENTCKGTENIPIHKDFRIIATMTPPLNCKSERLSGANITTNSELSPALYNRFTIVNMENQMGTKESLEAIFKATSQEYYNDQNSTFVQLFLELSTERNRRLNIHHFIRTIKTAVMLAQEKSVASGDLSPLYTGIEIHILGLFNGDVYENMKITAKYFYPSFSHSLSTFSYLYDRNTIQQPYLIDRELSPSRYDIACILSIAVICNFPCLLEGPASTGKSSIVKYLAQCHRVNLEEINNTDSTTINDYVGSIMPDGSYAKGPLVRAMENGSFFLADEFNLAEPAVLNLLYPLLEGKKTILLPDTNEYIIAKDGFRIFATQNWSSYAGRKELPQSLRCRFTDVPFGEFSEKEICEIILKRSEFLPQLKQELKEQAKNLSRVYTALNKGDKFGKSYFSDGAKVTLREIVKWINRKQLFPNGKWGLLGFELFYTRMRDRQSIDRLALLMSKVFGNSSDSNRCRPNVVIDRSSNKLVNTNHPEEDFSISMRLSNQRWDELDASTMNFKENLWNVCIAAQCKEPILLCGPTSYKSHLISMWCQLLNRTDIEDVLLNEASDSTDFLGRLRPYSVIEYLNLGIIKIFQFVKLCNRLLTKDCIRKSDMYLFLQESIDETKRLCESLQTRVLDIQNPVKDSEMIHLENNSILHSTLQQEQESNDESVDESYYRSVYTGDNETSSSSSDKAIGDSDSDSETTSETNKDDDAYYRSVYTGDSDTSSSSDKAIGDNDSDSETKSETNKDDDAYESINHDNLLEVVEHYKLTNDIEKEYVIGNSDSDYEDDEDLRDDINERNFIPELQIKATKKRYMNCLVDMNNLKTSMSEFLFVCKSEFLSNIKPMLKLLDISFREFCVTHKELSNTIDDFEYSHTSFIYQDGPCTKAVKQGSVLILRDLDLPSQAVMERLNSVLDIERTFALNENPSIATMDGILEQDNEVVIPANDLAVFATVHVDKFNRRKVNISPSTYSRMTEILITPYEHRDLIDLLLRPHFLSVFSKPLDGQLSDILSYLQESISLTSRDIVNLREFVLSQHINIYDNKQFCRAFALGMIYLWVDQIQLSTKRQEILHLCKFILNKFGFCFDKEDKGCQFGYDEALLSAIEGKEYIDELLILKTCDDNLVQLGNTPLYCSYENDSTLEVPNEFVIVKSTFRNICRVFAAAESGLNLLLNGPPGVGKTKIIEHLAKMLGFNCQRFNFSNNTSYEDLIGSFVPKVVEGKRVFCFVEGALLKALKSSGTTWILLDEINLAHPTVLQKLLPLLTSHKSLRIEATGESIELGKTHIFATKNPDVFGGGRIKISDAILSKFSTVYLSEFDETELRKIGSFKLYRAASYKVFPESFIDPILKFHVEVSNNFKVGAFQIFNLRDLEKFILVCEKTMEFNKLYIAESNDCKLKYEMDDGDIIMACVRANLELIYSKRFEREEEMEKVRSTIEKYFPIENISESTKEIDTSQNEFVRIHFLYLKKGRYLSTLNSPLYVTPEISESLVSLASAVRTGLPILLKGGTSAGKTSLVLNLANIAQRKLVNFPVNKDTTTSDLIGSWAASNDLAIHNKIKVKLKTSLKMLLQLCFEKSKSIKTFTELSSYYLKFKPIVLAEGNLHEVRNDDDWNHAAKEFCSLVDSISEYLKDGSDGILRILLTNVSMIREFLNVQSKSDTAFVFIEGPLIEAVRNGYWFLLDNIGMAPGDVIERLNSLLEADPKLILFEGANDEILTNANNGIHKDFRLFATYNTSKSAHLFSMAFLNRCIVINFPPLDSTAKEPELEMVPAYSILCHHMKNIKGCETLALVLLKLHRMACQLVKEKDIKLVNGFEFSVRNLLLASNVVLHYVKEENTPPAVSLTHAIHQAYCDPLLNEDFKKRIYEEYLEILKETKVKGIEKKPKSIAKCYRNDIIKAFGDLVSLFLQFIGVVLRDVSTYIQTSNRKVTNLLGKISEHANKLLISFETTDQFPNLNDQKNLLDHISEVLKNFQFETQDTPKISSLESKHGSVIGILQDYVMNANFINIGERLSVVACLRSHYSDMKVIINSMMTFLDVIHAPEEVKRNLQVDDLFRSSSILSILEPQLKLMTDCHHDFLLKKLINEISVLESIQVKENNSEFEHHIQQMSVFADNLEKVYKLSIIDSFPQRTNLVKDILKTFPNFKSDMTILIPLARIEFMAVQFSCMNIVPISHVEKPLNVINWSYIHKMEYLYRVKTVLQEINTECNEYKQNSDQSQVKETERHRNHTKLNFTKIKQSENFIICKSIADSAEELLKDDLKNYWTKQYNEEKKMELYHENAMTGSIFTGKVKSSLLEIFYFYHVVLEELSRKGFRVWLEYFNLFQKSSWIGMLQDKALPYTMFLSLAEPIFIFFEKSSVTSGGVVITCYTPDNIKVKKEVGHKLKGLKNIDYINLGQHFHRSSFYTAGAVIESFYKYKFGINNSKLFSLSNIDVFDMEGRAEALYELYEERIAKIPAETNTKVSVPNAQSEIEIFLESFEDETNDARHSIKILDRLNTELKAEYENMFHQIEPNSFSKKCQLNLLLQSNQAELMDLTVTDELWNVCSGRDVTKFLIVSQLYEQFKQCMNILEAHLVWSNVKDEDIYGYICDASKLLLDGLKRVFTNITFVHTKVESINPNIYSEIEDFRSHFNKFLENSLIPDAYELMDIKIDRLDLFTDSSEEPCEVSKKNPQINKKMKERIIQNTSQSVSFHNDEVDVYKIKGVRKKVNVNVKLNILKVDYSQFCSNTRQGEKKLQSIHYQSCIGDFNSLITNFMAVKTGKLKLQLAYNVLNLINMNNTGSREALDSCMKKLVAVVTVPDCLKIKDVAVEKIDKELSLLIHQLLLERMKSLIQLKTGLLTDLVEFVDILSLKHPINIGNLSKRLMELHNERQILIQCKQECKHHGDYLLRPDFFSVYDFICLITKSPEIVHKLSTLGIEDDQKLLFGQTRNTLVRVLRDEMCLSEEFIEEWTLNFQEQISIILSKICEENDKDSVAMAICSTNSILQICSHFLTKFHEEVQLHCRNLNQMFIREKMPGNVSTMKIIAEVNKFLLDIIDVPNKLFSSEISVTNLNDFSTFYAAIKTACNSTSSSLEPSQLEQIKAELTRRLNDLEEKWRESKNHLDQYPGNSNYKKLFFLLGELLDVIMCCSCGFTTSLIAFCDINTTSQSEKENNRVFYQMKQNIHVFVNDFLSNKDLLPGKCTMLLNTLREPFAELCKLHASSPKSRTDVSRKSIKHAKQYLTNLVLYCRNIHPDDNCTGEDIGTIFDIKLNKMSDKESLQLYNRLYNDKHWLEESSDAGYVSLFLLEDMIEKFDVMELNFEEVGIPENDIIVSLMNLSNSLDSVFSYLGKSLKEYINVIEYKSIVDVIETLTQVWKLSYEDGDYEDMRSLFSNFCKTLCNYLYSVNFSLEENVKKMTRTFWQTREQELRSFLGLNKVIEDISLFMVEGVITSKYNICSLELNKFSKVIGSCDEQYMSESALVVEYIQSGLRQVIPISCEEFRNPFIFTRTLDRFQRIVTFIMKLIDDCVDLIKEQELHFIKDGNVKWEILSELLSLEHKLFSRLLEGQRMKINDHVKQDIEKHMQDLKQISKLKDDWNIQWGDFTKACGMKNVVRHKNPDISAKMYHLLTYFKELVGCATKELLNKIIENGLADRVYQLASKIPTPAFDKSIFVVQYIFDVYFTDLKVCDNKTRNLGDYSLVLCSNYDKDKIQKVNPSKLSSNIYRGTGANRSYNAGHQLENQFRFINQEEMNLQIQVKIINDDDDEFTFTEMLRLACVETAEEFCLKNSVYELKGKYNYQVKVYPCSTFDRLQQSQGLRNPIDSNEILTGFQKKLSELEQTLPNFNSNDCRKSQKKELLLETQKLNILNQDFEKINELCHKWWQSLHLINDCTKFTVHELLDFFSDWFEKRREFHKQLSDLAKRFEDNFQSSLLNSEDFIKFREFPAITLTNLNKLANDLWDILCKHLSFNKAEDRHQKCHNTLNIIRKTFYALADCLSTVEPKYIDTVSVICKGLYTEIYQSECEHKKEIQRKKNRYEKMLIETRSLQLKVPENTGFNTRKIESELKSKEKWSLSSEPSKLCIELGYCVNDIPADKTYIILTHDTSSTKFSFSESRTYQITPRAGKLPKGELTTVQLESSNVTPNSGRREEDIVLKLQGRDKVEHKIQVTQIVGKIDLLNHISNESIEKLKDSYYMDLGTVTIGVTFNREIQFNNPLQIPLRIKFSPQTNFRVEKDEIVLYPDENKLQCVTMKPVKEKGEHLLKIHFSESLVYDLKLRFNAITPNVNIKLDGKRSSKDHKEVSISTIPFSRYVYNRFLIENSGKLDITVKVGTDQRVSGSEDEWTNLGVLKSRHTYKPKLVISSTRKIKDELQNINFNLYDGNNCLIKSFKLGLRIKSHWPLLVVEPKLLEVKQNDITRTLKHVLTFSSETTVQVRNASSSVMELIDSPQFPLEVGKGKNQWNQFAIKPEIDKKMAIVTLVTNCENPLQTFCIPIYHERIYEDLVFIPRVLDLSRHARRQLHILIRNQNPSTTYRLEIMTSHTKTFEVEKVDQGVILKKNMGQKIIVHVDDKKIGNRSALNGHINFRSRHCEFSMLLPTCYQDQGRNLNGLVLDQRFNLSEEVISTFSTINSMFLERRFYNYMTTLFPLWIRFIQKRSWIDIVLLRSCLEAGNEVELSKLLESYIEDLHLRKDLSKEWSDSKSGELFWRQIASLCYEISANPLKTMIEVDFGDRYACMYAFVNIFEHYYSPYPIGTLDWITKDLQIQCTYKNNKNVKSVFHFIANLYKKDQLSRDTAVASTASILELVIVSVRMIETESKKCDSHKTDDHRQFSETLCKFNNYFEQLKIGSSTSAALAVFSDELKTPRLTHFKANVDLIYTSFSNSIRSFMEKPYPLKLDDLYLLVSEILKECSNTFGPQYLDSKNIFELIIQSDLYVPAVVNICMLIAKETHGLEKLFCLYEGIDRFHCANDDPIPSIKHAYDLVSQEKNKLAVILDVIGLALKLGKTYLKHTSINFRDSLNTAFEMHKLRNPIKISDNSFATIEKSFDFVLSCGEELLKDTDDDKNRIPSLAFNYLELPEETLSYYKDLMDLILQRMERVYLKTKEDQFFDKEILSDMKKLEEKDLLKKTIAVDLFQVLNSLKVNNIISIASKLFALASEKVSRDLLELARVAIDFMNNEVTYEDVDKVVKGLNNIKITDLETLLCRNRRKFATFNTTISNKLKVLYKVLGINQSIGPVCEVIFALQTISQKLEHIKEAEIRISVVCEGAESISKLIPEFKSSQVQAVADIISFAYKSKPFLNEELFRLANKFLVVFSKIPEVLQIGKIVEILSSHSKRIRYLGYHSLQDIYESVRKFPSDFQEEYLEILRVAELVHHYSLDVLFHKAKSETDVLQVIGNIYTEWKDILLVSEYLLRIANTGNSSTTLNCKTAFITFAKSLSFLDADAIELVSHVSALISRREIDDDIEDIFNRLKLTTLLKQEFQSAIDIMLCLLPVFNHPVVGIKDDYIAALRLRILSIFNFKEENKNLLLKIDSNRKLVESLKNESKIFPHSASIHLVFDTLQMAGIDLDCFCMYSKPLWIKIIKLFLVIKDCSGNSMKYSKVVEMTKLLSNIYEMLSTEEQHRGYGVDGMNSLILSLLAEHRSLRVFSSISFSLHSLLSIQNIGFEKNEDAIVNTLEENKFDFPLNEIETEKMVELSCNKGINIAILNSSDIELKTNSEAARKIPQDQPPESAASDIPHDKELASTSTSDLESAVDVIPNKESSISISKENICDIMYKISAAEKTVQSLYKAEVLSPILTDPKILVVDVKSMITIVSSCYRINEDMRKVIEKILYSGHEVFSYLSPQVKEILDILIDLIKAVSILSYKWMFRIIDGQFEKQFKKLFDCITRNIVATVDVIDDDGRQSIIHQLIEMGIELNFKTEVYDYNIKPLSTKEFQKQAVNRSKENSNATKRHQLTGKMSMEAFQSTPSIPFEYGINRDWLTDNSSKTTKEHYNYGNRKLTPLKALPIQENQITKSQSGVPQWKEYTIDTSKDLSTSFMATNTNLRRRKAVGYRAIKEQDILKFLNARARDNWLKNLTEIDDVTPVARYQHSEALEEYDEEKLRYPLLARLTRPFQSECVRILTEIKRITEDGKTLVRDEPMKRQFYLFLFLVDNSGSMNGEKMTMALNILIVLLESLKRMEFETAVVRFGGKESQVTLKHFNDKMDQERGQYIIESFDASEKTLAADALKYVSETDELYGEPKTDLEHRFIILISDGIWEQQKKSLYDDYLLEADSRLLVITTHPRKHASLQHYHTSVGLATRLLDHIAPNCWTEMDLDMDFSTQINKIATIIDNNLRDILKGIPKLWDASKQHTFSSLEFHSIPGRNFQSEKIWNNENNINIDWGTSIFVSDINEPAESFDPDGQMVENFQEVFREQNDESSFSFDEEKVLQRAKLVRKEEHTLEKLISHLNGVIDTVAFPSNRPTRMIQDYHGSSFSLKGFIKFLCTDGQYKKIYENMAGHPRKDYMVSVILDVSKSMAGMAAYGSKNVFISLAASISSNNINFALYTVGSHTTVVKAFHEEWDDTTKAKMYESIQFNDNASNISDAVFYAARLSFEGGAKVKKTIYIITDGYPSAPKKLRHSLAYAESLGIHTVAVGVGYFTEGIFTYFPNFVVVNNPKDFPLALQKYYCGEVQLEGIQRAVGKVVEKVMFRGRKLVSVDEAWRVQLDNVYKIQVDNLKKELRLATVSPEKAFNELKIDLCIVLDTTGSMRQFINLAKEKIFEIIENIIVHVKQNSGQNASLRTGFVGFKRRYVTDHLANVPLTEDHISVQTCIRNQQAWEGGGIGKNEFILDRRGRRVYYEDKEDGLLEALLFQWQGTVKFMVLISDAPDRGKCGTMEQTIRRIAEKEIYLLHVNILDDTNEEKEMMRREYQNSRSKIRNKGFREIDIKTIAKDNDAISEMLVNEMNCIILSEFI